MDNLAQNMRAIGDGEQQIDARLLALLAKKIGAISIEMENILVRSARSSVLALARDCSTAICDAEGNVIAFPVGFPIHVGAISTAVRWLLEFHGDDLRDGDAYLNNSPYHGNSHPADHTIFVPVMHEGECLFICVVKAHQADIGNSIPTTYHYLARDVYEEGCLIFPHVRVQRGYQNIDDVVRMAQMRIRVPEVWYGDYLAAIGAARIGENELRKLVKKYSKELIKEFCVKWQEYGEERMKEEIKKLPAGTAEYTTTHDPVPGRLADGFHVKARVTIDPEEGFITCDFTENGDSVECGINSTEATLTAAGIAGILNRLSIPDFPHCEGAYKRIRVRMREGAVGKAKHPFSSAGATMCLNDRAMVAVMCALNQLTDRLAMGEPHYDMGIAASVISGKDSRDAGRPYVTQIISGWSGGPGVNGHDGFVHFLLSPGGMVAWNSVEMIERYYPVLYVEQEFAMDRIGSGKWDGGPAVTTTIGAREDPVTFTYACDGAHNAAKGAEHGLEGAKASVEFCKVEDAIEVTDAGEKLPAIGQVTVHSGEAVSGIWSSSGGYGDPLDQDPERVRHKAREGWISVEKARDTYGVVLDTKPELYAVDWGATRELRELKRGSRS